jgi:predicted phage terminase large subunit-like protein
MSRLVDIGNGVMIDPVEQMKLIEQFEYENSLYHFLTGAWPYIDPSPWKDGWPIEAVAEHLQAVCDGDIKRLLINIPPRMGKSSITSVAFPAWVWAQREHTATSGPGVQFLCASYGSSLAMRDSVKCRRLIESAWYQGYWGDRFELTSDQNTKGRFLNDKRGERLITSVDAKVTGEGGSIIIVDDPNAANEAFSEANITATKDWWDGTMSTRLNDQKTGAMIVIQQRLAEDDLTGHILENDSEGEWTHLCLPMKFEKERSFVTSIGWEDPRTEENELLWPDRFGDKEVDRLERALGPFGAAGQLQQRPEPAGGGVIKTEWWLKWEGRAYPPMDYIIASLDTAYTLNTNNDYSAMTVWGVFTEDMNATALKSFGKDGRANDVKRHYVEGAPKLMLMHAWQERLEIHQLMEKVADTCKRLKVDKLLVENKAAGISVAQELRRVYSTAGWAVQLSDPKSQDKLSRLYSIQHLFADGIVFAPDLEWAQTVITQVGQFPKGKHDDLVDTVSMAVRHLRDLGLLTRSAERREELDSLITYPGKQNAPLYAC